MTSPSTVANRNRWLTAIGYGLLAEVCTIITIIIVVSIYRYGIARRLSTEGGLPASSHRSRQSSVNR